MPVASGARNGVTRLETSGSAAIRFFFSYSLCWRCLLNDVRGAVMSATRRCNHPRSLSSRRRMELLVNARQIVPLTVPLFSVKPSFPLPPLPLVYFIFFPVHRENRCTRKFPSEYLFTSRLFNWWLTGDVCAIFLFPLFFLWILLCRKE